MYAYAFDRRFGQDRVAEIQGVQGEPGDLLYASEQYVLLLGQHVAFSELGSQYQLRLQGAEIAIPQMLSQSSLDILHRFVEQRLTTYKQSLPLWIGIDPSQLVNRKIEQSTLRSSAKALRGVISDSLLELELTASDDQQLIVFPNMFALQSVLDGLSTLPESCLVLHGQMTIKQRSEAFWMIKQGLAKTVLATYSQIFQDWNNLASIILVDQHTRYYKNQQDPRYHAVTCVGKLAEVYNAELVKTGRSLS